MPRRAAPTTPATVTVLRSGGVAAARGFVGRTDEVARVLDAVARDRGVVVAGRRGLGRTRLLAEAVDRLEQRGWRSVSVAGTRELGEVRFGAFASLLPLDDAGEDVDRFTAIATALQRRGDRVVLAIDDAHLLDDRSIAVLRHVVDRGGVAVLLSVCADEPVAEAIATLWESSRFERVELHPLDHFDVGALLQHLSSRPFHPSAVRWVWSMSGGNPRLAHEIVVGGLEDGGFTERDGMWVQTSRAALANPRIRALVAGDLAGLDDDDRRAVEHLAFAGILEQQRFEQLVGLDVVERLERRGLLRSVDIGRRAVVELDRRLLGEVVLADMGRASLRRVGATLCDSLAAGPSRRASDRVRLAAWRFRMGESVPLDELLAAATHHLRRTDVPRELWEQPVGDAGLTLAAQLEPRLAAEMAAAVFDASPTLARALYLSCLQAGIDDGDAEGDLAVAVDRLAAPEAARVGVIRADETLAVAGRVDVATAVQKLVEIEARTQSPTVAREARAYRAAVLILSTEDIAAGMALADEVAADADADPVLRTSAALTVATALMESGRAGDAIAALDELPARVGRIDDPVAFGMQILARVVTLGVAGRLAEAVTLADNAVELCVGLGDHHAAGAFLTARSSLALEAGRVADARADADAALQQLLPLEQFDLQRLAAALGARACASLGDRPGATAFLDRIEGTPPHRFMSRTEEVRARVWCEAAAGRAEAAVARLEGGIEWLVSHGQLSRLLLLLHDFARLDVAHLARERIEDVAPRVQSTYAEPILDHVLGLADRDPDRVEAAAMRFGELGTSLWEAEAWAQAARLHERHRARTRASRGLEAARQAIARCQGATTPALAGVDTAGGLSRREREVGMLAATGLADKEIAARLGVSVRTVETHLSSAYAKLGVQGRVGLTELFGREDPHG